MSTVEIETPKRVGEHSNGLAMTPEEFDAIEDWDEEFRYELVRGKLVVSPIADVGELKPNDMLGFWFLSYREYHPQGKALDDTCFEITVKTATGRRRTDRAVWCGLGKTPDYRNDVPSIAIEFVADSARDRRRDYIEKRAEYAEIGVREYWVIDRFRRILTVYKSDDTETVHEEASTVITDLLPGFELDRKRLLEIADLAAK